MEKRSIEVIVGKEPKGSVDESKALKGTPVPPKASEVGGRSPIYEYVSCPRCGAINYILADTSVWEYFRCWNDGYIFTA